MFPRLGARPPASSATSYEADGQTRSISFANGVTTAFAYSSRRWLAQITTTKGATRLMDNLYTHDLLGRITGISCVAPQAQTCAANADSWAYTYDNRDRLTIANNLGNNAYDDTITYALNGNMLSRTSVAGAYVYPLYNAPPPACADLDWRRGAQLRRQRQHHRRRHAHHGLGRGKPAQRH